MSALSTTRQRNARRWYVGSVTADAGAGEVVDVALAWTAATTGGSQASLVLAAAVIPRVLIFPIGGAVADRVGLARVAQITLGARIVLMAAYVAVLATGFTNLVVLALIAAAFATADGFHDPAMRPMTKQLTRGDQAALTELNGASTAARRTMLIGATFAAGLLAGAGPAAGVLAFLLVMAALLCMRVLIRIRPDLEEAQADSEGSMLKAAAAGITFAVRSRTVRWPLTLLALSNMIATPAVLLGIPLRSTSTGWPGWAYGLVYAAFAAGGVLGAMGTKRFRKRYGLTLRLAAALLLPQAAGLAVIAVSESPVFSAAAAVVVGICGTMSGVVLISLAQDNTPQAFQGRVGAMTQFSIGTLIPVGLLLYGVVSHQSLTGAGLGAAVMLLLLGAVGMLVKPVVGEERV